MSALSATTRGRILAESLMVDEGVILRPSATSTLNTMTGVLEPDAPVEIHRGPCRVRMATNQGRGAATFGQTVVTELAMQVWFPWNIPAVQVGDLVRISDLSDEQDAQLPPRTLRVAAVPSRTFLHFRELTTEVVE